MHWRQSRGLSETWPGRATQELGMPVTVLAVPLRLQCEIRPGDALRHQYVWRDVYDI